MKTKVIKLNDKKKNNPFKKIALYGAVALGVAGVSSFGLFNMDLGSTDRRVEAQHEYVHVDDNIDMSEYDLKKLKKYAKRHDGELPFDPVLEGDDTDITIEDVIAEENSKLGKAPNKKYW